MILCDNAREVTRLEIWFLAKMIVRLGFNVCIEDFWSIYDPIFI